MLGDITSSLDGSSTDSTDTSDSTASNDALLLPSALLTPSNVTDLPAEDNSTSLDAGTSDNSTDLLPLATNTVRGGCRATPQGVVMCVVEAGPRRQWARRS